LQVLCGSFPFIISEAWISKNMRYDTIANRLSGVSESGCAVRAAVDRSI
jgi:hypothetical protein